MSYSLNKLEKETIITYNAAETFSEVYTADPRVMKKLDALVKKYPEHYSLVSQDRYSKSYKVASKKLISFRAPRILTDEQKDALRERLNEVRK